MTHRRPALAPAGPRRLDTGVAGLGDILNGGLPAGQMYLLEGDPGTGKTTLAMQFIMAGMAVGERAVYITLSEPARELRASAASHGWPADALPIVEIVPAEESLSPGEQYTVFHPSEVELASTMGKLLSAIERERPERVVIDSLSELRLLTESAMRYRRQLLALKQYFAGRETTVLLLDDRTGEDRHDLQLHSITHGVIRLEKIPRSFGVTRRHIEILKLRGSAFREGFHDYVIRHGGVAVFPRLIAAEHDSSFVREQSASEVAGLDALLDGGLRFGTSTLVLGPTGVGKSTVAMCYAYAAAARGQRSIVYSFDEVLRTAKTRCTMLGMDVEREIDRGTLAMSQVDPAELSPGEFTAQIRAEVEERGARVVVIDSLNGFLNAMPGERDLILHLHELIAFLNQKGVVTLLVLAQHGLIGAMRSELDASYLADTVVLLRYFEDHGIIRQAVSVLKQRIGRHERSLREISFGESGITVGEPLTNFRGVLTGVPDLVSRSEQPVSP